VCSLHSSIAVALGHLGKIDPDAACRARYRYSCFDRFGDDAGDASVSQADGSSRARPAAWSDGTPPGESWRSSRSPMHCCAHCAHKSGAHEIQDRVLAVGHPARNKI
jgi:hypothetical protein